MQKTFILASGVSTREVNTWIRESTATGVEHLRDLLPDAYRSVAPNRELRRAHGRREYVHGVGNGMRDTHAATYEPNTRALRVTFPANYPGWDRADAYTRMRVHIYDLILRKAAPYVDHARAA